MGIISDSKPEVSGSWPDSLAKKRLFDMVNKILCWLGLHTWGKPSCVFSYVEADGWIIDTWETQCTHCEKTKIKNLRLVC